jgi:hypothetical protein
MLRKIFNGEKKVFMKKSSILSLRRKIYSEATFSSEKLIFGAFAVVAFIGLIIVTPLSWWIFISSGALMCQGVNRLLFS